MFRFPFLSLAFLLLAAPTTLVQGSSPEVCVGSFLQLGFDLGRFDLYPTFFRPDSVMQLAQAGSYVGPDDIAEYVGFATQLSPYIAQGPIPVGSEFKYSGFNVETGTCEFVVPYVSRFIMNPATTRYAADYKVAYMVKIFYDLQGNFVPRVNVFYPEPFLDFFFGNLLNSDQTRGFLCDSVLGNVCNGIVNATAHEQCINDLALLPEATGPLLHVDGNSQGCRGLHGAFALINPQNHCAHVSLTPLEDPKMRIKCQESYNVSPTDLFTEEDFSYFAEFTIGQGLDPAVGVDEKCTEGMFCNEQRAAPKGCDVAADATSGFRGNEVKSPKGSAVTKGSKGKKPNGHRLRQV